MAVFPTDPVPSYEQVVKQKFRTVISLFDSGNEQRRAKWTAPRYDISLQFNALTLTEANTLWNFYSARQGSYEAFYYFVGEADNKSYSLSSEYVATADGASSAFNLPCKHSTITAIYYNGSPQSTSAWSISSTNGANGEDILHTVGAPSSGAVITVSGDGHLKVRCRFANDEMSRSLFEYNLYKIGIELTGLGPST